MEQEEITKVYETLAPMAGDYANAQAEQIGMAQQSMGPLAANTMGTTTSGLGNYTYNRLLRPQVDTMRDEIMVQGYANQLNRLLSDKLNEARNRYNRGKGGGGDDDNSDDPDNKGTTGVTKIDSTEDEEKKNDGTINNSGSSDKKKKTSSVSTVPSTAKEGEVNAGTATFITQDPNDENHYIRETKIVTRTKDGKYRIPGVGEYTLGSKEWQEAAKKYGVVLNGKIRGSSINEGNRALYNIISMF